MFANKDLALTAAMNKTFLLFLLISIITTACFHRESKGPQGLPLDWQQELALTRVYDENPDVDVVEVSLEAVEADISLIPGATTRMWTYNGSVPGPLIEANVGDTLIVHLVNKLPQETSIHWHGLEVPALMDGSHLSQLALAPGASFTYQFKLTRAATYWYHPHFHSNEQVEKGLYGALIVRDKEEDKRLGLPTETELVLMLDDILLDDNGQIRTHVQTDPLENATTQANGREGNWFMLNGKAFSMGDNIHNIPTIKVKSGVPLRLRLINVANARFFRLSVPDHTMYRVGGDGGLLEQTQVAPSIDILEQDVPLNTQSLSPAQGKIKGRHAEGLAFYSDPDLAKGVMLVPGERGDVVFTPQGYPGDIKFMEWHFHDRGIHKIQFDELGQIQLSHEHLDLMWYSRFLRLEFTPDSNPSVVEYVPPVSLKNIETLDVTGADILPVTFGHSLPDMNGNMNFFATVVNGVGVPFDQVNSDTSLKARVGQTYVWEVTNLTMGDHPFHPHGFSFQWLETQYVDQDNPGNNRIERPASIEWKDTIRVPGRLGSLGRSKTIMRLAARFDDAGREGQVAAAGKTPTSSSSGGWFVHCHILEHSVRGMGTYLELGY